jgi:hypothetical protein
MLPRLALSFVKNLNAPRDCRRSICLPTSKSLCSWNESRNAGLHHGIEPNSRLDSFANLPHGVFGNGRDFKVLVDLAGNLRAGQDGRPALDRPCEQNLITNLLFISVALRSVELAKSCLERRLGRISGRLLRRDLPRSLTACAPCAPRIFSGIWRASSFFQGHEQRVQSLRQGRVCENALFKRGVGKLPHHGDLKH